MPLRCEACSVPATVDESAILSDIIETQSDLAAVELDLPVMLAMIAQRTQRLARADGVAVELVEDGVLICQACSGVAVPLHGQTLALSKSLAGASVRSGSIEYAADTHTDPRVDLEKCRQIGIRSLIAVPLFNADKPIGVVMIGSARPHAFSTTLISALRLMAGLFVASLSHSREFEIKKKLLAERTAALGALRDSEERFHSAFQHAAIGMALVGLDGKWLQVNEAICQIVGYSEAELLVSDFQSITYPADLEADLAYVRRLIAGEIPGYQMVKRYIHRNGHLVWVLLSVSLVRDPTGKPLYFISQIQDITQRQQAEAALRSSEEEYRAIFDLAGVGTVQSDLTSGRFTRVNQKFCEITGYTADELRCMTFEQLTHPEDLQVSRSICQKMRDGTINDHWLEKRYIRKDGHVIWVSINAACLRDEHGRTTRAVATVLDVTARKHSEWLEQDRRMILEMVARDAAVEDIMVRLALAVEKQISPSIAAVAIFQEGDVLLRGGGLPQELRTALQTHGAVLTSRLSRLVCGTTDRCAVTHPLADPDWSELREAGALEGIGSCWVIGIDAADGRALGLLLLFGQRSRRPTAAQMQTLDSIARLATVCIEHHQAARKLAHLVRHDPLTGLPNRLQYDDRLQQAMAMSRRTGNSVGLMMLDIDQFKLINDTLGHQAGDQLLKAFALRLRGRLRETDTLARIGGDEFVVVLPELKGEQAGVVVAQKLIDALIEPFALDQKNIRVTTSIGFAIFPQDGQDAATLLQKADEALYQVKRDGRNGFRGATPVHLARQTTPPQI